MVKNTSGHEKKRPATGHPNSLPMGRHWAVKMNQIIKGMNLTDFSINIGEGGASMDKGQVWTQPFSAKRLFFQLNGW